MDIDDLTRRVLDYANAGQARDAPLTTSIQGLTVMRARAPTALTHTNYAPVFCLVLQGAKQATIAGRNLTFGRMESLVVSLDLPGISRIVAATAARPYVALALDIDGRLIRELADDPHGAARDSAPIAPAQTLAADADILDAMGRLFALIKRPEHAGVLAPLVHREIHYWLLSSRHGPTLRQFARPDSHAARISRVISLIRRDFAQALRVTDLARLAGMSASAFHDHFRAVTGTSPVQFQKQLRLAEARRMLIADRMSVAGAAFAVGYESPTQFSREYARAFGISPRQDVAAVGTSPHAGPA